MGDLSADEPAWGTPPERSTADPGQPAQPVRSAQSAPDWGTPQGSPQPRLDPSAEPEPAGGTADLLTADAFAVIEQSGFMTSRRYELVAMNGALLGELSEQTSAGNWLFGGAAASAFTLTDAAGELVATMQRPGSFGRFQFVVFDASGAEAGTVEQENAFFAPQFELSSASGLVMRLAGGLLGGTEWELQDADDESLLYGRVSQEFAGLSGVLGGTQRFTVRLSSVLTGASRLLAVTATACLDYVRDSRKRR